MSDKTNKGAHLIDVAIPNSHDLHSTITENLQQYTDQKEELTTNNGVATERHLYSIISNTYKGYYPKGFVTALSYLIFFVFYIL